jgi:hypothetical protein
MLEEDENVNAIRKLTEEFDEVCFMNFHLYVIKNKLNPAICPRCY